MTTCHCGTTFGQKEGYGRCCSPSCVDEQNRKLRALAKMNARLLDLNSRALGLSSLALAEIMKRRREPGHEHEHDEWIALNAEVAREIDLIRKHVQS